MRLVLSVAILVFSACDSPSKTEEFCTRADSCNALVDSVEECIEDLDAALGQLAPSQRDELLYEVQRCLDRPSCDGFRTCINSLRVAGEESPMADLEPTVE